MLKSVFVGSNNYFDLLLADWLSRRTELKYCFWTNKLLWSYSGGGERKKRVIRHFLQRTRKYGLLKSINEIFYFLDYRRFIQKKDQGKLKNLVKSYWASQGESKAAYREVFIDNIDSDHLVQMIKDSKIDIMLVTCINVMIPRKLYSAPALGTFLWHEGIVPEYKGVHSAFWALYNRDYHRLGYTLLKMGDKLDSGPIFVQGPVRDVDPLKDFWSYIGHKAIYDSLPEVEIFLKDLEGANLKEIDRGQAPSGFYTYPGFTQVVSLLLRRKTERIRRRLNTRLNAIRKEMPEIDDETKRIRQAYHTYGENESIQERWSIDNKGQSFIIAERNQTLMDILKKEGYFPLEDKKILDIGCGYGKSLTDFLNWGAQPQNLYGVDLLANRIEKAKKKYPQLIFQCQNAEKINFSDRSFDLILFFTVLSSILDESMAENISRQAIRVLKDDGAIILWDAKYPNPFNPNTRRLTKHHVRRYFKGCQTEFKSLTLLPPLARFLAPLSLNICYFLQKLPLFRSHYLVIIKKLPKSKI